MSEAAKAPTVSSETVVRLATFQHLSLEAGLSQTPEQLRFRLLNRTAAFLPYDRAVLLELGHATPHVVGISGTETIPPKSPLVKDWARLARPFGNEFNAVRVTPDGKDDPWTTLYTTRAEETQGLDVVWLPIRTGENRTAALWLERWEGRSWSDAEIAALDPLGLAYGVAWNAVCPRRGRARQMPKRFMALVAIILLLLALILIKIPLRIVAPCRVIADAPMTVAAPLDGVIQKVLVRPGDAVSKGDILAIYEEDEARRQLALARQEVEILNADLARAEVQALEDRETRLQIALLKNRLEKEVLQVKLLESRLARMELRAPADGVVVLDDPDAWTGRSVMTGERILQVVDPARTRIVAWIGEGDRIPFADSPAPHVILTADPGTVYPVKLAYVARHTQLAPDGFMAYRAEAVWDGTPPRLNVGQVGSATLYGEEVRLAYWLGRRTLGTVRVWLGW